MTIKEIPKNTGGATNDSPPSTPSKGEELTPEQVEDMKIYNQEDDEDYDEMIEVEF